MADNRGRPPLPACRVGSAHGCRAREASGGRGPSSSCTRSPGRGRGLALKGYNEAYRLARHRSQLPGRSPTSCRRADGGHPPPPVTPRLGIVRQRPDVEPIELRERVGDRVKSEGIGRPAEHSCGRHDLFPHEPEALDWFERVCRVFVDLRPARIVTDRPFTGGRPARRRDPCDPRPVRRASRPGPPADRRVRCGRRRAPTVPPPGRTRRSAGAAP